MSTKLQELTEEKMGALAGPLLDAGAVVPLGANKRPLAKWSKPVDHTIDYPFEALAFKTGAVSGITVVDHDADTPDNSNTITRRGGHVYVGYKEGDRSRSFRDRHIDVRGDGGLAVFHSEHHHVITLDLRDRGQFLDLLDPKTGQVKTYKPSRKAGDPLDHVCTPDEYRAKVEAAGFTIDVEHSTKMLAGQVASAPEGVRHMTFYKNLSQTLMIGGNTHLLLAAAYKAGLGQAEINQVFHWVKSDPRGIDVLKKAQEWLSEVEKTVKKNQVAPELVRLAVEQTSMNPFVSQTDLINEVGIPRNTVPRHLTKLEEAGFTIKKTNGTIPGTFKTAPNNYRLILPTA